MKKQLNKKNPFRFINKTSFISIMLFIFYVGMIFGEEIASDATLKPQLELFSIDFSQRKKEINCGIFQNNQVKDHALQVLEEIEVLHSQILIQIKQYNEGNYEIKGAIEEKIDRILKDLISNKKFPKLFDRSELKGLEAFFSSIAGNYKRLKEDLFQDQLEPEEKLQLRAEKDKKLSQILRDEQKAFWPNSTIFCSFLKRLSSEIAQKNITPTVYFAYAWPSEERMNQEYWIQEFLKNLQAQLKAAGIHTADLDIVSNRYGANIYEYMEKTESNDYVLLFGTESLKDKHDQGLSAVCAELLHILRKRQKDLKENMRRIFPILLSGNHRSSFPPEYERYITVRDWRQGGYLKNFQSLYLELFDFSPEDYLECVEGFWSEELERYGNEREGLERKIEWSQMMIKEVNKCSNLEKLIHFSSKSFSAVNNLKSVHPDFIERPSITYQLQKAFSISNWKLNQPTVVRLIWGIGGVGKTELATAFSISQLYDFSHIFKLDASNQEQLLASYKKIAARIGCPIFPSDKKEDVFQRVHHYFEESHFEKPWLLIYDNAEEPLQEIPARGGCVLITSRYQEVWRNADEQIFLSSFEEKEALELISKITKEEISQSIRNLAYFLDYFPLLINNVAHFIQETPGYTVQDYLDGFDLKDKPLEAKISTDNRYKGRLQTVWDMTLSRLQKENHEAIRWLKVCSYLHPDHISFSLLEMWVELQTGKKNLGKAIAIIRDLNRYALIRQENPNTKSFSIHRILQKVLQEQDVDYSIHLQQGLDLANKALSLFSHDDPKVWAEVFKFYLSFLPLISYELDFFSEEALQHLLGKMGMLNFELSNIHQAITLWESQLNVLNKRSQDPFHSDRPEILTHLGQCFDCVGQHSKSFECYKQALEILDHLYKKQPHIDYLRAFIFLGASCHLEGNYKQAFEIYQQALSIHHNLYKKGKEKRYYTWILNKFAELHNELGEYSQAFDLLNQAQIIQKKDMDKDHLQSIETQVYLGVSLMGLKRTKEAVYTLKEALQTFEELVKGKPHQDTAQIMNKLADAYNADGAYTQAVEYYHKAHEIIKALFGLKPHFEAVNSLRGLGIACYNQGNYEIAYNYANQALDMVERLYPNTLHLWKGKILKNLGDIEEKLGNYLIAKDHYEQARRIFIVYLNKEEQTYPSNN